LPQQKPKEQENSVLEEQNLIHLRKEFKIIISATFQTVFSSSEFEARLTASMLLELHPVNI
jgi:hypothetical protein